MTRTAVEILTTFANGQQLVEGVFSAVQPDGEWKVEKYYTRPVTSEVVAKAQTNLAKLSRFSRTAIVGACWVGCFLAAVVLGIILASPLNILSPLGNLAFGGLVSLLGFHRSTWHNHSRLDCHLANPPLSGKTLLAWRWRCSTDCFFRCWRWTG